MVTPRTGSIAALLAALSALAAGGCEQGPSVQEVEVPAPPAPGGAEAGYRELPGHWVLLSAGGFFGRTIGAGAACSDEAAAFRMLLARPDAAAAFKDLLERARLGGQLYGLCGLWHTDPVAFRAALPRYAASRELLTVQWYGCLVDRRPVGELVRAEGPAVARLDGPGDSVAAWARRQGMAEDASPQLDIEGGGFPAVLAAPDERDAANAAEAREALAALASSDAEKRILGAEGIAGLRSAGLLDRAPAAARACGALLSDPDEAVREAGLRALEQLGAWSAGALPALRAFLERDASTEDPEEALERTVRCVDLLGWIGPRAAGDLERLLAHEHPFVRAEALEALGRMARFAGVSAETFARRLEDGSEEVRAAAALALGWLGAEGRAAAARLRSLGGDPSPLVRLRAGVALWRVARE
ncbi:MAG: HEAT repeat domain-containing protein, partial [Planctomycetes bacterium]|nr:HEAT repeat domain-containing protein [Planctomycetota bacterium]